MSDNYDDLEQEVKDLASDLAEKDKEISKLTGQLEILQDKYDRLYSCVDSAIYELKKEF